MISKKLLIALRTIHEKLKDKKIKWALIGSTNLALQGIKIRPKDIDILTDKNGALEINRLLKEYELKPVRLSHFKLFGSQYFGEFKIEDIKIEVIGRLKKKKLLTKIVEIDGMNLPVVSLKEELKAYETLRREKDFNKIKKIKNFLKGKSKI
jgi:predicted nucleotidyltransferase